MDKNRKSIKKQHERIKSVPALKNIHGEKLISAWKSNG